ncbi:beta-4C adrenergic receptor-like [Patiria miniata]|uniref:G-protein coupled receptors family 1 profile domain-containing protein n=1 Tax=Patiria miniata TaxID=46514 RepID=A0A914B0Y8_PATMI|nr:beta-4C adrenergic receptor-like [Patiria miniata]
MNSTGTSEDLSTFNASTTPMTQNRIEYNFIRCILLSITTILLLTLNPLCLVVLRHVRSIQETTKIFLRSMTVADLGVGLFRALPMTVLVISETEHIGDALCKVLSFVDSILLFSPQMSLLLLTVDRYISVVHALRYPSLVTVKRACISVCCMWGVVVLMITVYGFTSHRKPAYIKYIPACMFQPNSSEPYVQIVYSTIAVGTLLVILAAYARLFMISRHLARAIQVENQIAQPGNPAVRPDNKALKTVLIIVLTASAANLLPVCAILLLKGPHPIALLFTYVLPVLTNSWLNVVIYYLRNQDFRRMTHDLLISNYRSCKRCMPFAAN